MSAVSVTGGDEFFAEIAAAASAHFALTGQAEAEAVCVSPREIQALNAQTRDVDAVTDVLSFPALTLTAGQYAPFDREHFPTDVNPENGRVQLGSIVICDEVAARQAREYGHSTARERGYLFLHGLLHLLGFDHVHEEDRAAMRTAEEEILNEIGLRRE